MVWPLFDLPDTTETFRPRLDGRDVVYMLSDQGFYEYLDWPLHGWTGGWNSWVGPLDSASHVVEIVDSAGRSWGRSAPLAVPPGGPQDPSGPSGQYLAVVFAQFSGKAAVWNIDPATQDDDPATDEITVTNVVDADVVVERCLISSGLPSACTPVGTVAAGADLLTVEKMADVSTKDEGYQALVVHLAGDASQSYQRDLLQEAGDYLDRFRFGSTCQVERIIVHGTRQGSGNFGPTSGTVFAMSSCYGYGSGPM